jgi:hypothetical protein
MYKCLPVAVLSPPFNSRWPTPLNPTLVDELGYLIRKEIVPVVAQTPWKSKRAISRYYGDSQSSVSDILKEHGQDEDIAREAAEAAAAGATADLESWPTKRPSSASSILVLSKPSQTAPATSISSRLKTNSKSAIAWTARSTKCPRRPNTWRCRSSPA